MVDIYGQLNERQLAVLQWICEGCPDGVMHSSTYKTTAIALQNRRLVTVSKKRGTWRAEPTDAGRYYLKHDRHPDRPTPAGHRHHRVTTAATALTAAKEQEEEAPREDRRTRPRRPQASTPPDQSASAKGNGHRSARKGVAVRYRVMVSRVQVAERYVRAVDEEDAVRKVQEELGRPYSFIGGWRTVDTDLDVVEAESPLEMAPAPLDEDGTALLPLKRAAAHLGISYSSLWRLMQGGEIDHVEVGGRRFISRDGLKAFIEANTRRGTTHTAR